MSTAEPDAGAAPAAPPRGGVLGNSLPSPAAPLSPGGQALPAAAGTEAVS